MRRQVPDTSLEARDNHEKSGAMESNRERCLRLVQAYPGLTAVELCEKQVAMTRTEVSRRLPELITAGQVRKGEKRVCSINKSSMATWWPVTAGKRRETLFDLEEEA